MATAETVDLGPPHPPKEDSIVAFKHTLPEIKHELIRLRREYTKHEPEYFAAVEHLEDEDLRKFDISNLTAVRVATSAYGIHLFGKIRIPALPDSGPAYIHVRLFISEEPAKLHSIHTEEREEADGDKKYRAIFTEKDELEWFDT
ncbi:unnamed protein product [Clonostachys solani]|uniref:Uncharacterized protein n=1 Tax=Clonostachys solani TaxID=160281 RepID=A0A9P0ENG4_9HYPO|nr:unnamed protein product [Clonostachys solani]